MAVFKINEGYCNFFYESVSNLDKGELYDFFVNEPGISNLIRKFKKALRSEEFLLIKGNPFINKSLFELFVKQFGSEYYGLVEHTDIKLDCPYYGCTSGYLEFHNDNAIDSNYPLYGFIQVIKEDPLKLPKNGVVRVKDIVEFLELYNNDLLYKLLNNKVPMLSYGIYYESKNKEEILKNETILYNDNGVYKSRFDFSRIKYYYWKKNMQQSIEERKMIYEFLEVCKKLAKYFYLEKGDILIHNNHTTLHDRTECSFELDSRNENTREIYVSFINKE